MFLIPVTKHYALQNFRDCALITRMLLKNEFASTVIVNWGSQENLSLEVKIIFFYFFSIRGC